MRTLIVLNSKCSITGERRPEEETNEMLLTCIGISTLYIILNYSEATGKALSFSPWSPINSMSRRVLPLSFVTSQKASPSHTFYVKIKASKINTKQTFFVTLHEKQLEKMLLWRPLLHEHVFSIMTLCSGHFFREQQKSHQYNYTPFKYSQISLVGLFLCLVSSKAMICLFPPLALSLSLFLPVGFSWDWKWMPTLEDACQREAVKQLKRSNCFCVSPQWLKGRNILSLLWHESSKAAAEEKKIIFARTLAGPCAQKHCNV